MRFFERWLRKIFKSTATTSRSERRRQRTARPSVEALESRTLMTVSTTFVNDNWHFVSDNDNSGTVSYLDEVDSTENGGGVLFYGLNAFGTVTTGSITGSHANFDTISEAITGTNVGGTTNVLRGTYVENVLVDKSVHLVGLDTDVAGNGITDVTILPAGDDTKVIEISDSNVEVRGLTIDGNNPALTGVNSSIEGTYGILVRNDTTPPTGVEIHDNTVRNIWRRGIQSDSYGASFNIHHNTVTNVAGAADAIGIMNFGAGGLSGTAVFTTTPFPARPSASGRSSRLACKCKATTSPWSRGASASRTPTPAPAPLPSRRRPKISSPTRSPAATPPVPA